MARPGRFRGSRRDVGEMRVSVVAQTPEPVRVRTYAEARVGRLRRHSRLQDASMVVTAAPGRTPPCHVELVVHLHHTRLVATADAETVQEAIDVAVDRADHQVLRQKEKITDHKGLRGADGIDPVGL